jgi:MFS family permease
LYGTPGGAVEVVFLIACGWAGDKYGNRILISMIGLLTAILGMLLIVALPLSQNSGRLAGYYLTQASPTPFVAILSLLASNVAGYTKKTSVAAMFLIGYCVGNIIGILFSPSSPFSSSFSLSMSYQYHASCNLLTHFCSKPCRPTDVPSVRRPALCSR